MKNKLLLPLLFLSLTGFAQLKQRTINEPLPSRQVHLDFHTSGLMPGIGEKFDKKQFQEALKTGHVNQINIFAKDHSGFCMYPTKVGNMHPNLKFDLLRAEMEACHEIGVKCPFYFTVGWSANDAEQHPEWCVREKDGKIAAINYDFNAKVTDPKPYVSWKILCPAVSGTYHQYILKNVEEICKNYDLDGFWFDIYHIKGQCHCQYCTERMKKEGIDINDSQAVSLSFTLAIKAHMKELRELIARYKPNATVFFNSATHIKDADIFKQRVFDMNTHQELEDLPSVWGGYDKLPLEAKYHLQQGVPVVAMSGKFHKDWGEFGGFKNPDAIKYEAASMISFGASCNFGDHLYPSGVMDMSTYKNIGEAYKLVEKIEDYGPGGMPVSKLGMWLTLENSADLGVVNMLLEMHYDFIVANENNLDQLELLIIPSRSCLTEVQASKINNWVKKGGKLIVFENGALDASGKRFILDVGATFLEKSPFQVDYTIVEPALSVNMVESPFLNYQSGLRVKPTSGTTLAHIREPYFDRTYKHYSGHRDTPYRPENSAYPAVLKNGSVIFFAHHLDKLYFENGVKLHREIVKNAIDLLYTSPMLKVNNLPSCGRVSFLKQESKSRYVAHLLYAAPISRGDVMVVEDFLPVPGVEIEVNVPEKVKKVYQIPDGKKLDFTRKGNKLNIKVPTFTMHTGIVLEY
jgi:hypothetical protein